MSLERGEGQGKSGANTQGLAMYANEGVGGSGSGMRENVTHAPCQPHVPLEFYGRNSQEGVGLGFLSPSSAMFYDATAGAPKPSQSAF